MDKLGLDIDQIDELSVVLVDGSCDNINSSEAVKSFQFEVEFEQVDGHRWSHFMGFKKHELNERVAQEVSRALSLPAIYFIQCDTSGWMGYTLWEDGEVTEEYSFGLDYSEEMEEAGIEMPEPVRKEGTVVAKKRGDEFIFWSRDRTMTEAEICAGEKIINEFLQSKNAYVGWELWSDKR